MIKDVFKLIFIAGLSLLSSSVLFAQETVLTDTLGLEVHFRLDRHELDPSYLNNEAVLSELSSIISEARNRGLLHSVEIQAYVSPEGPQSRNDVLALARTKAMADWLATNCGISADFIKQNSGGVGWNILRDKVASSDVSYREKVLEIIDSTPVWIFDTDGRIIGGRRKSLMDLSGGSVWMDVSARFFPEVRCCLAAVVREIEDDLSAVPAPSNTIETDATQEIPVLPLLAEVIVPEDSTELFVPENQKDTLALTLPPVPVMDYRTSDSVSVTVADTCTVQELSDSSAVFALKTNLLSDAALIPNIGIVI